MYEMNSIVDWSGVDFTMKDQVMYPLASYHEASPNDNLSCLSPEERVLKKLTAVERKVDHLLKNIGESPVATLSSGSGAANSCSFDKDAILKSVTKDLVVKCSPTSASLVSNVVDVFVSMLQGSLKVAKVVYCHCSCSQQDKKALKSLLDSCQKGPIARSECDLVFSVIITHLTAKGLPSTSGVSCGLYLSPTAMKPIFGEINLMRFLARLLAPSLYPETEALTYQLDMALTECSKCVTNKQLTVFMKKYLETVSNTSSVSLVDLYMHCKYKALNVAMSVGSLKNGPAWSQNCQAMFGS